MKKNHNTLYYLLFLIVSVSLVLLLCFQLEPDYFWHIKAGEKMLEEGVLRHDIFSWSVVGKYWMSHEWLFEILLASIRNLFGNIHVYLYCFFFVLFLYLICFIPNRKEWSHNLPYGLFYLLFFSLLLAPFIQARPHLMSLCFLGITIWFLMDYYHNKESKKIWFLPIISILWANVHGGSSNLAYLLCFLFGVGGCFSFQYKKIEANRISKKQIRTYFFVMILCMIGVCINPHGFKMFLYPYQNMMDTTMIENIREWQATSLGVPIHYLYYGFLLFIIFTYLFSEKKIQWMDFLLFGFGAYLGLKSIRFWAFCPIIMSFSIYPYVKNRKLDKGSGFCMILLGSLLIGIFAYTCTEWKKIDYHLYLEEDIYPILKEEKPERLFNMYDYGGELIYHDIDVFIDGRADYYSPYNYLDYLHIAKLEEDYVKLIEKYDFDYFLVDEEYPISTYLKYHEGYQELYHEENVHLYKKIAN